MHDLTKREVEVLQLIMRGLSNPEIAKILFVAPCTVKTHTQNIILKLGVSGRGEAAYKLFQFMIESALLKVKTNIIQQTDDSIKATEKLKIFNEIAKELKFKFEVV